MLVIASRSGATEKLPMPVEFSDFDRNERYVVEEEADEFGLVSVETQDRITRVKTITVYHPSHEIPDEFNYDRMSRSQAADVQSRATAARKKAEAGGSPTT